MNEGEFYKRTRGIFRPQKLRGMTAVDVGLGSGGSRFAAQLGRLGLAQILVDRPAELLEEHNIIRHVLGWDWLGKPKLTGMAEHIRNLNPSAQVTTVEQIALIQARVALNLLLGGEPDLLGLPSDVSLIVFSNRVVKGAFSRPLHADFFPIAKRPDCLVCGAPAEEIEAMAERILASLKPAEKAESA